MARKKIQTKGYLTGKLLVATPQIQDLRYAHTVIYVCGHDTNGAMGLVVNRLIDSLSFKDLLEQLDITIPSLFKNVQIHFGGPVELGRGFVLHSTDYQHESSVEIDQDIALTATIDILKDIACGQGPHRYMMALGYAGWSPGQLEDEIQNNSWLLVDPDEHLIFGQDIDSCWIRGMKKLGIDPSMLSSEAGHA
ncbi:MAG: YqgE/AlgH family protein [Alphaproteobacteria bacterium]|nr:YqgE/AlgH family protein [Alphaproteobacteria bacterium]